MKGMIYDQALAYGRQLWRYKWLSIGLAWLLCAIGWVGVALIPPRYDSSARVYVNADQLLTPLLRGIATDIDPKYQVEFLQRTLLSRPNLEQVIHLSDLDLSSKGRISDADREDLLRRLALEVAVKPQTANLFTISYQNTDPTVAKNVVQALLTVFAENSTGGNRKEMENAKRFLDQQIQRYEAQLRAAEQRRAEFHEKYLDLLPGLDGTASRLDAARNGVVKMSLEVADIRARRDALQKELGSVPKILSVDTATPQVIVNGKPSGPRERLEDARGKLSELLTRYTEQHPDVIALHREIGLLEAEVAKASSATPGAKNSAKSEVTNPLYDKVKFALVDAESALASAERRLKQAEDEQSRLEEKVKATPGILAQAQDLDRDYTVKKKNFDELLQRREQTRIGEAADTTADKIQFRIIDPPQVPIVPSAPNQPLLLSGVLLVAIGAAIGVPLLLLQFDRSYASVTALRNLGLPVLGSVSLFASPTRRRQGRIQVAALCASATVLVMIYGVLLTMSSTVYRFGLGLS